jgi:hypothetical protein
MNIHHRSVGRSTGFASRLTHLACVLAPDS